MHYVSYTPHVIKSGINPVFLHLWHTLKSRKIVIACVSSVTWQEFHVVFAELSVNANPYNRGSLKQQQILAKSLSPFTLAQSCKYSTLKKVWVTEIVSRKTSNPTGKDANVAVEETLHTHTHAHTHEHIRGSAYTRVRLVCTFCRPPSLNKKKVFFYFRPQECTSKILEAGHIQPVICDRILGSK